jgi:two-component system sensor histidine kinase ChvG
MGWWRSVRLQALALVAVLLVLPVLVLAVLGQADEERRALVLAAVSEAGAVIGTGLAGELEGLTPSGSAALEAAISRFAATGRVVRVLLRPRGAAEDAFYLLAAAPAIPPEALEGERRMLVEAGVLPGAADGCDAPRGGDPVLLPARQEVLTAVVTVAGRAGCWAVVIGTDAARLRGVADPEPYWQRPEARVALAIYALMAGLIALIFSGVWGSLRRMGRLAERARAGAEGTGFAAAASVPELAGMAAALDAMVGRLRRSAEMLREAAEANAHAFKGPIGTIRHALEPLRRHEAVAAWLGPVDAALNRLDGLVRSARVLDGAAAEMLEPEMAAVDVSALAAGVVAGYGASHPGRVEGRISAGVVVRGREEALETVLENLVENALGFAPPGGVVRVVLRREGAEAILAVEDDGPGVAPERLGQIFERYYSDRPRAEAGAHFGIGLWLARQNVLLLGGAISAANRAPHGLAMTVRLPALP